jgi:HTH-type transcriptional regulator/antitoxin HigA
MTGTMKASNAYIKLVKRFPLKPIRDRETFIYAREIFKELGLKGLSRNQDETDYLMMLGRLIADYEAQHLPQPKKVMAPHQALASLMEDNNLSQTTLAQAIDTDQGHLSAFLSGKRGMSVNVILKLADYFKVSPRLFMSQQ